MPRTCMNCKHAGLNPPNPKSCRCGPAVLQKLLTSAAEQPLTTPLGKPLDELTGPPIVAAARQRSEPG